MLEGSARAEEVGQTILTGVEQRVDPRAIVPNRDIGVIEASRDIGEPVRRQEAARVGNRDGVIPCVLNADVATPCDVAGLLAETDPQVPA